MELLIAPELLLREWIDVLRNDIRAAHGSRSRQNHAAAYDQVRCRWNYPRCFGSYFQWLAGLPGHSE